MQSWSLIINFLISAQLSHGPFSSIAKGRHQNRFSNLFWKLAGTSFQAPSPHSRFFVVEIPEFWFLILKQLYKALMYMYISHQKLTKKLPECTQRLHTICTLFSQYFHNNCTIFLQYLQNIYPGLHNICPILAQH